MKAVIAGLGGWGSSWAGVINDSPDWEIAAWVDTNPLALQNAISSLNADPSLCFPNLNEAIEKVRADAVFIFTPPMCGRLADITAALDAGLHVLAEKPLTDSLEDARAMLKKQQETGLRLMVAQNYRFFAGSANMRDAVRSQSLGRLCYANVLYNMTWDAPTHHATVMENGFVLSVCLHHLDTMRFVVGEPAEIQAQTWNPPGTWSKSDGCVSALFSFPNDVRVNYFGSWSARRNQTDWYGHWDLEFEDGALWSDGTKTYTIKGNEKLELPGSGRNTQNTRLDVLNEFTAAIREDRTPACSIEDNLKTLEMAFAITGSAGRRG